MSQTMAQPSEWKIAIEDHSLRSDRSHCMTSKQKTHRIPVIIDNGIFLSVVIFHT